jgi:hypothetical protein
MKNQNSKVTAVLFVVALALAPMVQAAPAPQGGPGSVSARNAPTPRPRPAAVARPQRTPVDLGAENGAGENSEAQGGGLSSALPTVTIYSTDNVIRGKIGTFVLRMKPTLMFGGTYANFSLSGTAAAGADYVTPVSPVYISQTGYGVIQIQTLANLRGAADRQAYSVVVTLQAGAGYKVGKASQAVMWIKP